MRGPSKLEVGNALPNTRPSRVGVLPNLSSQVDQRRDHTYGPYEFPQRSQFHDRHRPAPIRSDQQKLLSVWER